MSEANAPRKYFEQAVRAPAVIAEPIAPANDRTWSTRLTWLALFAVPAAVLVTAAFLTPSASGHGTHTQLGLPPCGFLVLTGFPCPGCGLTTAFAHMIRGHFIGAAHANPFGVPLFLVTAATIPISFAGAVRAFPVIETLERFHVDKVAILLAVTAIFVWIIRITTLILA